MIYIQTGTGLSQITPSLTKANIIAALGYTPADAANFSFFEDESGALIVADEQNNVIARIDADGLRTTTVSAKAILLDGSDLAAKLKSLEEASGNVDLSNYYNKTEVDEKIPSLEGYAKTSDIPSLEGYAKTSDIPSIPSHDAYDNHIANTDVHVTADDKTTWNNKSDFNGDYNSLSNAPQILNENQDEMVVCDKAGNVIFRATADGINVAAIYINGEKVNTGIGTFYIRYDSDEAPAPMSFLPGMNFKDWANSSFCPGTTAYDETAEYYRVASSLAILENFDDYDTAAVHTTTLYEGKTFYCRADGL